MLEVGVCHLWLRASAGNWIHSAKAAKGLTHQDEPKDSDLQRWGLFVQTSTVCCWRIWGEDLDGAWRLYRGTQDRTGSYLNKRVPRLQEPVLKISPLQSPHLRHCPPPWLPSAVITWSPKNWLGFHCQSPTQEMIGHLLSVATAGVEASLFIVNLWLDYEEQSMFVNALFIWIGLTLGTEPGTG